MSSLLMESLGWALVHSLWQGALVALLLAGALASVGRKAAHARYALACGALLLSLALPVVAGGWHYAQGRAVETPAVDAAPVVAPVARAAAVGVAPGVSRLEVPVPAWPVARVEEAAPEAPALLKQVRDAVAGHLSWLVLAWVAGVGVCSGRMAAEWVKLRRLAREALPAPSEWQARLDALAQRLGLGRAVRLLQSSAVDVPAAVGWLSPVVLLPVSALSGLAPRQLEMVLAHELAHIRRHDFAVNLAQVLVETLLFYHPAVRWVSHVIRVEREHCCDDVAVSASGSSVSYAKALTALEALRVLPLPPGTAMSALGGSLPERVRRLISAPGTRCSSRWVAGASVLTLVSSLAVAAPLTSLVLGRVGEATEAPPSDARTPSPVDLTATAPMTAPGTVTVTAPGAVPPSAPGPMPVAAPGAVPPSAPGPMPVVASGAVPPSAPRPMPLEAPGVVPPSAPAPAPRAVTAPGAVPPPAPRAGVAPEALKAPLAAPSVIAPLPALPAAPAPAPAPLPALAAAPAPAPAPAPRPGPRDGDDELDARTTVGTGQPLTVDQLVSLKVAGVTPERVKELQSMGYTPTVANLVQMGHAGITPEYAKEMNGRFGRKLDADTLVELRHLGVTPAYIEALKASGFSADNAEEVAHARAVGVDEAYVRALKAAGYAGLKLEDLVQLRAVGVDPAYIDALSKSGLSKLSAEELTELRAMGVTPAWLDELRAAGLEDLSIDELVRLRAGGVDSDFIRKMRESRAK